jgi:hypothetical protein
MASEASRTKVEHKEGLFSDKTKETTVSERQGLGQQIGQGLSNLGAKVASAMPSSASTGGSTLGTGSATGSTYQSTTTTERRVVP